MFIIVVCVCICSSSVTKEMITNADIQKYIKQLVNRENIHFSLYCLCLLLQRVCPCLRCVFVLTCLCAVFASVCAFVSVFVCALDGLCVSTRMCKYVCILILYT